MLDLEGVGSLSLMHRRESKRKTSIHCFETQQPDNIDQFLLPSPLETCPKEQSLGLGPDSQLSIADTGKYFWGTRSAISVAGAKEPSHFLG